MKKYSCFTKRKQLCAVVTALLMCPTWTGFAASGVEIPDAGKILRDVQNNERTLPSRQSPNLEVGEVVRPPMAADTGFKVQVEGINVTGQDIFSASELDELLKDQIHKESTFSDLNYAAAIVTKHFKDHGYLLAQAYLPAQEIENGRVEIAVLVGRYGEIILKNTTTVSDAAIKGQLTSLKRGSYINNMDLERAVLLAGDLAGVSAKITLSPGKDPGTADVILEATDKKINNKGSISFNNWGNRFTGSNQGTLNYKMDNSAHRGDSLTGSITNAGSGLDSGSVNYRLSLAEGTNLNLGYSKVHYSLGEEYASLNAHGTAYTEHMDIDWNIKRSRDANLSLQAGYDHKRTEDLTDLSGSATKKWSRALSLGVSGDSRDQLWGGGVNSYSLMWYDGNLGAQSNTTMPPTGSWKKTSYNIIRQQYLTNRLSLMASLSGQWAADNLDSSEKFSLGGANGVRAYPMGEASGDEAWLMSSELYWTMPVKSDKGLLQLIGFYDAGVSYIEKKPTTSDENRRAIAGKGLGLSWTVPGEYSVKLNYAWKAGSEASKSDTDKNGRLWLQGVKYF